MTEEVCNMCKKPATVLDTEYVEFYCDEHAREYEVFKGPHKVLTDEDI